MIQWIIDAVLEVRIQIAMNRMLSETDKIIQKALARRMAMLISQRSPGQVERMERKAGLL